MSNPIYDIKLLHDSDLQQVAVLHKKAFVDSALSKLGLEPTRRYYAWQLNGPHDCFAIGLFNQQQNLLGFCFSGVFRGALSGFIANNKKFLVYWTLTHPWVVFNPIVKEKLKQSIKVTKKQYDDQLQRFHKPGKAFSILSIAVDPQKQNIGVGKIMMNLVEEEARKQGFPQLSLTVHPSNSSAVAFYQKCGWEKVTDISGGWSGSMKKSL